MKKLTISVGLDSAKKSYWQGCNVSRTHVDFMVGSAQLDIGGELEDGSIEPLFRQGNGVCFLF